MGGGGMSSVLEVLRVSCRHHGSSLFWNVLNMQVVLTFETAFLNSSKWASKTVPKWAAFVSELDVEEGQFLKPLAARKSEDADEDCHGTVWAVSTVATVLGFARTIGEVKHHGDRGKMSAFVTKWLQVATRSEFVFYVDESFSASLCVVPKKGMCFKWKDGEIEHEQDTA
eukprot:3576433-Amphidinium_carterae.1